MASKTIAIIGATGKMGAAIAKSIAGGNYRLLLFSRDKAKADALAASIREAHPNADLETTACPFDASWEADIIIPAVPYGAEKETAEKIRQVATQKIVISISNPLNAQYNGLLTDPGTSAAEELQSYLPHSKVVKAFNTAFAADYAQTVLEGKQLDLFIAGNDQEALQTVSTLVADAGFRPLVAGDLTMSRTLENMTVLLIQLNMKYGFKGVAGWKVLSNQQTTI
jgi:NADPH-dependent F420 reductase